MPEAIMAQGPVECKVRDIVRLGCWAQKLYEQVQRKPLDLYWGRRGWCPSSLPRCVKRIDFDELMNSGLVTVRMAQMISNVELTGAAAGLLPQRPATEGSEVERRVGPLETKP